MSIRTVKFRVDGQPKGKGRPRFTSKGLAYTPTETKEYEKRIQQAAWVQMASQKLDASTRRCSVIIEAVMEIPKSYSKKKTLDCQSGVLVPPRPDIDNIVKAALDGCNQVVFQDDAQVWHISAFKKYTQVGQIPHLAIKVQWDEPSQCMSNLNHI